MRPHRTLYLPTLTVFVLLLTFSAYADFQVGKEAFERGDNATALKEWLPLAQQGNPEAQTNLGFMYHEGLGMPRDYKEAARWYRIKLSATEPDHQPFHLSLPISCRYYVPHALESVDGTKQRFCYTLAFPSQNGVAWNWLPKSKNSMLSNVMNVLNFSPPLITYRPNIIRNRNTTVDRGARKRLTMKSPAPGATMKKKDFGNI